MAYFIDVNKPSKAIKAIQAEAWGGKIEGAYTDVSNRNFIRLATKENPLALLQEGWLCGLFLSM